MPCCAGCVFDLLISVDMPRCRICFRFADRGYLTVRVDSAVSSRSAVLFRSLLIDGCASPARLCRRGVALLIVVDIQRGQNSFVLLISVDIPLWSTRLCRPGGPSLCSLLLLYNWARGIFALPICYVVVGIYTLHCLLCQMCLYFAGLNEYTAMPDMFSLC